MVMDSYVSEGFDFNAKYPSGMILIDRRDINLLMSIYKLFTEDPDGIVGDDQSLSVHPDDFTFFKPNYKV